MRQTRLPRWIRWTTGALLLLAIALPNMASARYLQLASTPWSPFTDVPGKPRFAIELVEMALKRVGVVADTVIVDDGTLTPSLMRGEFDGSVALWKAMEREHVLRYSEPYFQNRLILVGRQGSDVSATSLADLAGKRIALVAGYAYGEAVETAVGSNVVESDSLEHSVASVLNGEADYTLMDDFVIQHLIKNHADEARMRLAFGSTPLLIRSLHLAIQRSLPDAESIISRFNDELVGMMVDGSYHNHLGLHWIRADVDGDGRTEYVPRGDRMGSRPPEEAYLLFTPPSPSPIIEVSTARRFYFGGSVHEGWSSVPGRYKDPGFSGPVESFSITFKF